jgi:hypothetical protein
VQRWLAFLQSHRVVIAAFDIFTVPTLSFRVLSRRADYSCHVMKTLAVAGHYQAISLPISIWPLRVPDSPSRQLPVNSQWCEIDLRRPDGSCTVSHASAA